MKEWFLTFRVAMVCFSSRTVCKYYLGGCMGLIPISEGSDAMRVMGRFEVNY